jgi:hypothetical protein
VIQNLQNLLSERHIRLVVSGETLDAFYGRDPSVECLVLVNDERVHLFRTDGVRKAAMR